MPDITLEIVVLKRVNEAHAKLEREHGTYVSLAEAVRVTDVPLSFLPRMVFDRWSSIIALKDTLDPRGYSLFADQDGFDP